jgi:hypothetical protein
MATRSFDWREVQASKSRDFSQKNTLEILWLVPEEDSTFPSTELIKKGGTRGDLNIEVVKARSSDRRGTMLKNVISRLSEEH